MIQNYFFSNILIYTINILLFGTFFSYLVYFFSFRNQYQHVIKNDTIYNIIKIILCLTLGFSYIFLIYFVYYYYIYYMSVYNYSLFSTYSLIPVLYLNMFLICFEFSVDFFGIVLLFLGYFVGVLSLLALDNRIF